MEDLPLVTVICLCHNHEKFLIEAIDSVINQSYKNIQIIIIDDASTDNSPSLIAKYASQSKQVQTILLTQNIGNCKAFNFALKLANGKYIIDFATDDVMCSDRIAKQVQCFECLDTDFGVIYSDAEIINEKGNRVTFHSKNFNYQPSGNIFIDLLSTYFICPPTMMFRKSIIDQIGGYDEELSYEDFDFWVRTSKISKYFYQNEVLTKKRIVSRSLSGKFHLDSSMTDSTRKVCEKAILLCDNEIDKLALIKRVNYEIFFAFRNKHFQVVSNYDYLIKTLKINSIITKVILYFSKWLKN